MFYITGVWGFREFHVILQNGNITLEDVKVVVNSKESKKNVMNYRGGKNAVTSTKMLLS